MIAVLVKRVWSTYFIHVKCPCSRAEKARRRVSSWRRRSHPLLDDLCAICFLKGECDVEATRAGIDAILTTAEHVVHHYGAGRRVVADDTLTSLLYTALIKLDAALDFDAARWKQF